MREHWTLDPSVTFLNHGSFGACPRHVLEVQTRLRDQLEFEPVKFFVHDLEPMLADARAEVAAFVGAEPEDFGFVRNATSGVNAVVRSLEFEPGDELLVTDHGYNACRNALEFVASRWGARVTVAQLPFPVAAPEQVVDAITAAATERTRLALIDHVTSPTGLVLPIEAIVRALDARGIDTLVDGAHAPGMVSLDVSAIGAAYYTANFHKWTCAPKGAGMLWVRRDRQVNLHPAVISHGYNAARGRKRFLEEIDWTGTDDPTPWLCVPEALRFLESQMPWPEIRAHNRDLAVRARARLAEMLELPVPAPVSMLGSLAALTLPESKTAEPPPSALYANALQLALYDQHRIEVPIPPWPSPPERLVRISAHVYNHLEEYERLGTALKTLLAQEGFS